MYIEHKAFICQHFDIQYGHKASTAIHQNEGNSAAWISHKKIGETAVGGYPASIVLAVAREYPAKLQALLWDLSISED